MKPAVNAFRRVFTDQSYENEITQRESAFRMKAGEAR